IQVKQLHQIDAAASSGWRARRAPATSTVTWEEGPATTVPPGPLALGAGAAGAEPAGTEVRGVAAEAQRPKIADMMSPKMLIAPHSYVEDRGVYCLGFSLPNSQIRGFVAARSVLRRHGRRRRLLVDRRYARIDRRPARRARCPDRHQRPRD